MKGEAFNIENTKSRTVIVFGDNGVGKTAFLTSIALENIMNERYREYYLANAKATIKPYIKGGFTNLDISKMKHLVYSNYTIVGDLDSKSNKFNSHYLDINRFGRYCPVNNPDNQVFSPCSTLVIDEGQRIFNSRKAGIPDHISEFFEKRRHIDLIIYMSTPRAKSIDINVRDIASEIIEIQGMTHKTDRAGNIVQTTWDFLSFDSAQLIDKYLESGRDRRVGKMAKRIFQGNIFEHYNSKEHQAMYMANMKNRNFEQDLASKQKFTVAYVDKANERNIKKEILKDA